MHRPHKPVWCSQLRPHEEIFVDGPCVVRFTKIGINGGKVRVEIEGDRPIQITKRLVIPKRKR